MSTAFRSNLLLMGLPVILALGLLMPEDRKSVV